MDKAEIKCKCPETDCEFFQKCEECRDNHKRKNKPVYCERDNDK